MWERKKDSSSQAPPDRAALRAMLANEVAGSDFLTFLRLWDAYHDIPEYAPSRRGEIDRAAYLRGVLRELARAIGEPRARELGSAFADLMIHQVALLNGVRAGAQALLAEFSPTGISARLERKGTAGIPIWPLRELALLRAIETRHREFTDEESAVVDVLFGKEFARAYSSVSGRRAGGGENPRPRKNTGKP